MIPGDERRLTQVIWNLIGNATKFTPHRGFIEVTASLGSSCLQIAVKDSGPGLSKEELTKVFDRFWQAEKTAALGFGLGLAIAKGIILSHGGKIWAESTLGQGSRFIFTIPLHLDKAINLLDRTFQ